MPQVLFNRDTEGKHSAGVFDLRKPISRNVSYARHQRHLNDKEAVSYTHLTLPTKA